MASDLDVIREKIQKELNKGSIIPSGKTIAVVAHLDNDGVSLASAWKVNDKWEIDGISKWDKTEGFSVGVNVIFST